MSSVIAEKLRNQTSSLIGLFTKRLSSLRDHPETTVLVKHVNRDIAVGTARDLIGEGEHHAVGIDGSMEYDERLEMLLFYVCATAFRCPVLVGDEITFELAKVERDSRLSVSAAVPLWLEDLSDVATLSQAAETDFDLERSVERIPYALMTLGELSLALNSLDSDRVKVIFLDRPISGTFGPSSRDLRILLRSGESSLTSFKTRYGDLTMLDLSVASVLGPGDLYVPSRGPYLVYAGIQKLLEKGELSRSELARELGLSDEEVDKLVKRLNRLNHAYGGKLLEKTDLISLKVNDDLRHYWDRVYDVCKQVSERVFKGKEHPLQLQENRWLTVLDINAVNVFLLYELLKESVTRRVLVVGVTKDTTATDFTRSVLPLAVRDGLLKPKSSLPSLKNDRAFLTIMAAVNGEAIPTPWRTLSYDSCFTTLTENKEDDNIPFKAARKVIAREHLFVKAYFQLRRFETDPYTRSPVFAYDRFYNHTYDAPCIKPLKALERRKAVEIKPYYEGQTLNPLDNLILYLLTQSDNPEVLEAYGHNQLLYLADKAVKAEVKAMKGLLRGVADLQLGTLARRERIFSISRRFRDLRSESEMARSRAAQEAIRG